MPAPWLLLHSASLFLLGAQKSPIKMKVDGDLTVTYASGGFDKQTGKWSFDQGVVLEYDVTTIEADHVEIDTLNHVGVARGHVHLIDPVAKVDAENLEMNWSPDKRTGHAENAFIQIGSSRLKAKTLDIAPTLWVLKNVEGTTSRAHPAWYEVHGREVDIYPGQKGKIIHPSLYILGSKIATFQDRTFNLDQRSEGITIPGFNYDRQYGLGVSWGGGFLLDHRTDLAFAIGAFPDARPGYGATVTRSFLPDSKPTTLITPISDLGERFGYGFMENVAVVSPEGEDRFMRAPRQSVAVDSVFNQVLTDRGTMAPFSKPFEGVYETGGETNGYGYIGQARLQSIRELAGAVEERALFMGSFAPHEVELTPHLRSVLRMDSNLFVGEREYGWVREFAGLAYMPLKQIRLSAGSYFSEDVGVPQYAIDPLYSKKGLLVRADFLLGPTKISYLQKYDNFSSLYDKEYSISQVVGCFEPFILYRKNPSDYQLGLRLRLDDLTDLMTKRNFSRTPPPIHTISPSANGNP